MNATAELNGVTTLEMLCRHLLEAMNGLRAALLLVDPQKISLAGELVLDSMDRLERNWAKAQVPEDRSKLNGIVTSIREINRQNEVLARNGLQVATKNMRRLQPFATVEGYSADGTLQFKRPIKA
jgi:hypothetical protein